MFFIHIKGRYSENTSKSSNSAFKDFQNNKIVWGAILNETNWFKSQKKALNNVQMHLKYQLQKMDACQSANLCSKIEHEKNVRNDFRSLLC